MITSSERTAWGYTHTIASRCERRNDWMSSWVCDEKTRTLQRDNKALLIVKLGFSVVAPIRIIVPSSTYGKRESCWALFQRWISSKKTIVFLLYCLFVCACCTISPRSLFLLLTQDNWTKSAASSFHKTIASVVFPHPGGHQKRSDGICPDATYDVNWATISCCQTTSCNFWGRRSAANGVCIFIGRNR